MTYRGIIHNGAVVLDEPVPLPEGAEVECALVVVGSTEDCATAQTASEADDPLMRFSGIVKGMPPDASRNVDHYLYGHPKV